MSWQNPKDDLKHLFSQILHGFKNQVATNSYLTHFDTFLKIGQSQWDAFRSQFPPPLSQKLQAQYDM